MKKIITYRPLPKKILALKHLIKHSLITLEASRLYGDTALHSTISTLSNTHGITFERKREAHIHQNGGLTYFTRYTLSELCRVRAEQLVAFYEAKHNE